MAYAPGETAGRARARLTLALGELTGNAHAVVRPGELVREPGPLRPLPRHLP